MADSFHKYWNEPKAVIIMNKRPHTAGLVLGLAMLSDMVPYLHVHVTTYYGGA